MQLIGGVARIVSLFVLLVLGLSVVGANVPIDAKERGYHSVLYVSDIHSANASSDTLVLNQTGYEFDDGTAILTTGSETELTSATQPLVLSAPGGGNSIALNSPQVGVGTTSPSSNLDVSGNAVFTDENEVAEFRAETEEAFVRFNDTGQSANVGQYRNGGDPYFFIDQDYVPGFGSLIIDDQGQVGVGTTSPSSALTVDGQIQTASNSQQIYLPGGTGIRQFVRSISGTGNNYSVPTTSAINDEISNVNEDIQDVNQSATQTISEVLAEGDTANDGQRVNIDEVSARDGDGLLLSNDANSPGVFVDDAGQTGVGTTSPSSALTVDGQIQTASNSQQLFLPGGTGIQQFVTSISGSGNDYSVPTTSAVDSLVDATYSGGDGTTIDGSNNIDITAPTCNNGDDVLRWDGSSWTCGTDRYDSNTDATGKCSGKDTYLDGNGNCRDMTSNTGSWFQGDNIQGDTVDSSEIQVGTLAGSGLVANSGDLDVKWEDANDLDSDGDVTGTKCSGSDYLAGDGTCKSDSYEAATTTTDGYLPDDPATSNVDMNGNEIVDGSGDLTLDPGIGDTLQVERDLDLNGKSIDSNGNAKIAPRSEGIFIYNRIVEVDEISFGRTQTKSEATNARGNLVYDPDWGLKYYQACCSAGDPDIGWKSITAQNGWKSVSDRRAKGNITPADTNMLSKFTALQPKRFDFKLKDGYYTAKGEADNKTGLIAQEVQEIFPGWVEKTRAAEAEVEAGIVSKNETVYNVDFGSKKEFRTQLIMALQDLDEKNEALKDDLQETRSKLNTICQNKPSLCN